jgi:zinc transport system substrate-binding protein
MKKPSPTYIFFLLLTVGTIAFANGARETAEPSVKPMIAVSILPQSYFVERIGESRFDTVVLVGEGQSPHSYEPTPRQMANLAQASAWILSSTDFEIALRPKIESLYPSLRIVDGTQGVRFRSLEAHSHDDDHDNEHHDEDEESDDHDDYDNDDLDLTVDRHSWLGREPAKIMAAHIKKTLTEIDPEGAKLYETNYQTLISEIDTVFMNLGEILAPIQGETVFVYHPSFGYFLDEFGIFQEAVETGGKEPTAKALSALIESAIADEVSVIFVQSQFPSSAARTVANAVGAQVIALDPLAQDWMDNIKRIGEALRSAVR